MALLKPIFMQAASGDNAITYSAQEIRAGLVSSIYSREGVLDKDAGHLRVTQRAAGANMSVDVAAGRCAVFGDDISDQGAYVCTNTTPVNLTVPARPASGSRVHRVIARVRDKLSSGSYSTYEWTLELLADTGSGTPALPNSAISLALVTVSSATTSITTTGNIEDIRDRATVGSVDRTGTITPLAGSYAVGDTNRPGRYAISANGWVSLAGFFRRTGSTQPLTAGNFYQLTDVLPQDLRGYGTRDFLGLTREGPVQMTISAFNTPSGQSTIPAGALMYRPFSNWTLAQDGTWFSLDGCGFRP